MSMPDYDRMIHGATVALCAGALLAIDAGYVRTFAALMLPVILLNTAGFFLLRYLR